MSESNLSGAVGEEEPAAEESVAERVAQVKAFQRAAKGFLGGESRLKGLEERRHKLFMAGPKASQSCLTAAIQEDRVRFPGRDPVGLKLDFRAVEQLESLTL